MEFERYCLKRFYKLNQQMPKITSILGVYFHLHKPIIVERDIFLAFCNGRMINKVH